VAGCALDNEKIETSITIEGIVQNTNNDVLVGVDIELTTISGKRSVQTNQSGTYIFENVSAGLGNIKLSYGDYYNITRNITIVNQKKHFRIDFVMRNFLDDYYLTVESTSITLKNIDTQSVFKVESNAGFTIESNAEWLKVNPSQSSSSRGITLSCEQNEIPEKREAIVTITGDYGKTVEVNVIQEPGPVLKCTGKKYSSYLPEANRDGVVFHFNRPVEVINIMDENDKTINGITVEKLNDGKSISLKGFTQDLYKEINYVLTVGASDGITNTTNFSLKSFLNSFIYTGYYEPEFIFSADDESFWDLRQYDIYMTSSMEKVGQIDKYMYKESIHYSMATNSIIFFNKTSEDIYVEFYDSRNGKFLYSKEVIRDQANWLMHIAVANNGMALISYGRSIYSIDLKEQILKTSAISDNKILSSDTQEYPEKITAIGNSFFLLEYSSSIFLTILDITTGHTKTINKGEANLDIYFTKSRSLPYFAYYHDYTIHLVNAADGTVTLYPLDGSYGLRGMNEIDGEITHIMMGETNNLYLLNLKTGKIERPDYYHDTNYGNKICSSSYTGNYLIIKGPGYNTYYLFESKVVFSTNP